MATENMAERSIPSTLSAQYRPFNLFNKSEISRLKSELINCSYQTNKNAQVFSGVPTCFEFSLPFFPLTDDPRVIPALLSSHRIAPAGMALEISREGVELEG